MSSPVILPDYSFRDQKAQTSFYVLLWRRNGISLETFDDYWRDVHGPVCARLPGQEQYWQFHVSPSPKAIWPVMEGIKYDLLPEEQFEGIAELTFVSEEKRQIWFNAAAILMDDEQNIFRKAIGYTVSPGNSKTYIDRIATGNPNGELGIVKYHVLLKKADGVSLEDFRQYLKEEFATTVTQNQLVLKFRLHLFDAVDNSRPDAAGVVHYEPEENQYQAAFEIGFSDHLAMREFLVSAEYNIAVRSQQRYIKQISVFVERSVYTFVYNGQITLAGQRGSRVAELITKVGAINQLKDDISALISPQINSVYATTNKITDDLVLAN
ncbi:EthD domain-containing protein [Gloeothece verrucosa]|uniref:Ethyl tert-butyl ether degradation EthD n=1 Tax=Gloeothece verrucosa (strain PCC 7822) TaxID=497965 RepID=E0ULN3_GLOV7|nr:EthD domain-containing protein [Gloeothece verrucosa]ADN17863.1 Ethyl tert-butyl ether degradation EthD [Gloeothece verrucosa PCC 7822]